MFEPFPKMARLNRDCVITEKIDGTNAQIEIEHKSVLDEQNILAASIIAEKDDFLMFAGSRNKQIWPGKQSDNAGFAAWVKEHADELFALGPGRHFGEWWGKGIQRGYGLNEKRFSLFNTARWSDPATRPACCHVVPVWYSGPFNTNIIDLTLANMRESGSRAVPGFMDPEGIVIFHTAANICFKVTCKDDASPKSLVKE